MNKKIFECRIIEFEIENEILELTYILRADLFRN